MIEKERSPIDERPHAERLIRIVLEHLLYAQGNADKIQEIAERLGISESAAVATVIVDHITEEFDLTLRKD